MAADGVDERLFEEAEVAVEIAEMVEADDRVADDLSGAVVGDVAAAIGADEIDAEELELFFGPNEVLLGSATDSEGEDGRVFDEDEGVGDFFLLAEFQAFLLALPCFAVGKVAPVEGFAGGGCVLGVQDGTL